MLCVRVMQPGDFPLADLEMPTGKSTIKQILENHWSFQDLIDEGDHCHECEAPQSQRKTVQLER